MLSPQEKNGASELLQIMSWEDLQSLSRTVTNGLIEVENVEEACTSILLHTKSVDELLSRQKITKELMFIYLHSKSIPCVKKDKVTLKQIILDSWSGNKFSSVNTTKVNEIKSPSFNEVQNYTMEQTQMTHNELAHKFTEWFYSLLNQSNSELGICLLGPEHFFVDCSSQVFLTSQTNSENNVVNEVENDSEGVAKLLIDTKTKHGLFFNPNLTTEGVRGKMDSHGLVMVVACGTLHVGEKCVGVFEQLFGLARDPFSENNWKIKYTTLNLKSQDLVTKIPALGDSDLGRTLLALQDSTTTSNLPVQIYDA